MPRQFDPSLVPVPEPIDASVPCYIITGNTLVVHNISELMPEATSKLRPAGFRFDALSCGLSAPFSPETETLVKETLGIPGPVEEYDVRVSRDNAEALKSRFYSGVWTKEEGRSKICSFIRLLIESEGIIGSDDNSPEGKKGPTTMALYRELFSSGVKVTIEATSISHRFRPYTGYVKSIWYNADPGVEDSFVRIIRMSEQEPISEDVPLVDVVEQENLLDFVIANILG